MLPPARKKLPAAATRTTPCCSFCRWPIRRPAASVSIAYAQSTVTFLILVFWLVDKIVHCCSPNYREVMIFRSTRGEFQEHSFHSTKQEEFQSIATSQALRADPSGTGIDAPLARCPSDLRSHLLSVGRTGRSMVSKISG